MKKVLFSFILQRNLLTLSILLINMIDLNMSKKYNFLNPLQSENLPSPANDKTVLIPKKEEAIDIRRFAFKVWEWIKDGLRARTRNKIFIKAINKLIGLASDALFVFQGIKNVFCSSFFDASSIGDKDIGGPHLFFISSSNLLL